MNCANHPDVPVTAYCQNCGKALCASCVRAVNGVIFCENCLAARLGMPGASAAGTNEPGPAAPGAVPMPPASSPSPAAAAILGFIPGVGAMYNGQYAKALVHVVVFVVLIGLTNSHPLFGLFIAAWVFYQVFDAHQTAKARRDGMALPDPFGLNELGNRMGMPGPPPMGMPAAQPYTAAEPYASASYAAGAAMPPNMPPAAPFVPLASPATPLPFYAGARREPVGAIVLIAIGLLFLLNTLGIFRFDWIGEGWPVIVIAIGVYLLVRRTRDLRPPAGGAR